MKCKGCNTIIKGLSATCPQCGRPLNAEEKTTPVSLFKSPVSTVIADRYEVIEEIGKGGMGRVYKAWDRSNEEYVAIKIIRPEYADDEVMLGRFKKEMLLTQNIFSDHVVKIHSFQVIDDINFIVMNYIDGESLGQVLDTTGTLNMDAIISISVQILKGLKAAHKETIIHRDLKPPNIMIDRSGKVSITDFGLARKRDASRVTTTSSLLGTPQYISPEQWLGEKPDARTDIYAFGIMLYEMAYGELPFKSSTDYGYMDLHLNAPVIFPKGSGTKIPGFLKTIILKCLEKKPARRYQNVDQILDEIMEGKASGSFTTKIRNRLKRTPKALWIVTTFFVVIAAAGIFIHTVNKAEEKKKKKLTIAVLNFSDMTDNEEFKFLSKGVPDLLTTDLSQSRHFYILPHEKVFQNLRDTGNLENTDFQEEELKKMAKLCGVNYLITGSITSSGDDIRVNIILNDGETGEYISGAIEECKGVANIYDVIDRLTWQIKKRIGITPSQLAHDPDLRVASITTENIEALTHFLKGRQLYHLRKFKQSSSELEKSIKIDEEFASAYNILHHNMRYLAKDNKSLEYFKKLIKTSSRLSEREQMMYKAMQAYKIDKNYIKASDRWRKMLNKYPYDFDAKLSLAGVNRLLKRFDKAEKLYVELKDIIKNSIPYQSLMFIYLSTNQLDKLKSIIKEAETLFPKSKWLVNYKWKYYIVTKNYLSALKMLSSPQYSTASLKSQQLGITYQLLGDTTKALASYKNISKSINLYKSYLLQAAIFVQKGEINKARHILKEGINKANKSNEKYSIFILYEYMTYVELVSKKPVDSLKACNEATQITNTFPSDFYDKSHLLLTQGLCRIGLDKESSTLQKIIKQLLELDKSYYSHIPSLYSVILSSSITGTHDDLETAYTQYFNENWYNDIHALFLNQLLKIYLNKKDHSNVLKTCQRIQNLTFGRILYGDVYTQCFYHMGDAHYKLQNYTKAKQSLQIFLKEWSQKSSHSSSLVFKAKKILKKLTDR